MEKVYARTKGIQPDMVDGFCPGCMHSTLFKLIGEVLEEMDMLDKCTCAIGVGCCGLGMGYFTYDYLLAAHGRACRGHRCQTQQSRHAGVHLSGRRRPGLHRSG